MTLCNIDTSKWVERVDVDEAAKVNCPLCAKALKEAAKDQALVATTAPRMSLNDPADRDLLVNR